MTLKRIVGMFAIAGTLGFSAIGLEGVANAAPMPQTAPIAQHAQFADWGGHGWGGHGWGRPGWGGGRSWGWGRPGWGLGWGGHGWGGGRGWGGRGWR